MDGFSQMATASSPHVVVSYKDDEEQDAQDDQHASLLPPSSTQAPAPKRRSCWKRLVLCISLVAVCMGIFEVAFHGKETESLHAAKEKISQLEQELGLKLKSGYDRVLATLSAPSQAGSWSGVADAAEVATDASKDDAVIEAVKRKSVIVLKTGASVLFDRLPVQLLLAQTALHHQVHLSGQSGYIGPQFLIYSDYNTQLGAFAVHDALLNVSSNVRNSSEFATRYGSLHRLLDSGEDPRASMFSEGWNLDKWKFLYMWQDAFRRNPTADWYIGYEADTFVFWHSLFQFLATKDATKEDLYGCASILISKQELFANGGCPYVVSGALMRSTFGKNAQFAERFDKEVEKSCCGDAELSIALRKSGTSEIKDLGDAGARFFNGQPGEILFEEWNWCQPILNLHHLSADRVAWLSRIERDIRSAKKPNETILYRDIFDHVIPFSLQAALQSLRPTHNTSDHIEQNPVKEDWEAFSSSDPHVSKARTVSDPLDCKQQCLDSQKCTVWFWIKQTEQDPDGDCYLMHDAVRIGQSYKGTGVRTSGWIAKRLASFKAQHSCSNPLSA